MKIESLQQEEYSSLLSVNLKYNFDCSETHRHNTSFEGSSTSTGENVSLKKFIGSGHGTGIKRFSPQPPSCFKESFCRSSYSIQLHRPTILKLKLSYKTHLLRVRGKRGFYTV